MLKELRTFLAVVRHGTFSRAGERIGLTQSAVSAQIKRLEETLGFCLFERVGRSATLNVAGRETFDRAEELVKLFDGLNSPPSLAFSTALRLGAVASVQASALPPALVTLHRAHPSLRTKVVPGVSLGLLALVDAGELDAAILVRPHLALPPELSWRSLWIEPFVLAVPQHVRGSNWRKLLATHAFLRYDRASFGGRLVANFLEGEGIEVNDVVEMDEIAGLIQLVQRGLGVSLLPYCKPYFPAPSGVRVIRLGAAGVHREIGLLERVRHPRIALIGALYDALHIVPIAHAARA